VTLFGNRVTRAQEDTTWGKIRSGPGPFKNCCQLELFNEASLERFTTAVDAIRDKFGHGSLVSGRAIELLNSLPKDAYGYVLRTPSLSK
jgi:hypothetical protein